MATLSPEKMDAAVSKQVRYQQNKIIRKAERSKSKGRVHCADPAPVLVTYYTKKSVDQVFHKILHDRNGFLENLIEGARQRPPMTPEERERQIISFAYGNVRMHNQHVTRDLVTEEVKKLAEEKKNAAKIAVPRRRVPSKRPDISRG